MPKFYTDVVVDEYDDGGSSNTKIEKILDDNESLIKKKT